MQADIPQWFFTIMAISLIVDILTLEWFNSKGKLNIVYPLNALKYFGFLFLETALALNDPTQSAVLLFNICNLFGLIMNIKGILRLRKEEGWPIKK